MKKVWCRKEKTHIAFNYNLKEKNVNPKERWRCPDCGHRFKVCSQTINGGDIEYWAPPHKKRDKK